MSEVEHLDATVLSADELRTLDARWRASPGLDVRTAAVRPQTADARTRHAAWIGEHGTDRPEVAVWTWNAW